MIETFRGASLPLFRQYRTIAARTVPIASAGPSARWGVDTYTAYADGTDVGLMVSYAGDADVLGSIDQEAAAGALVRLVLPRL